MPISGIRKYNLPHTYVYNYANVIMNLPTIYNLPNTRNANLSTYIVFLQEIENALIILIHEQKCEVESVRYR